LAWGLANLAKLSHGFPQSLHGNAKCSLRLGHSHFLTLCRPFSDYLTLKCCVVWATDCVINTLRTGDADLCFYITTVQDGWRKSAFLICTCFPCTIHLIVQYIEPVSIWSCWRMFIEIWRHCELTFRHCASSI